MAWTNSNGCRIDNAITKYAPSEDGRIKSKGAFEQMNGFTGGF
jgi:hypothetical protein